MKTVLITGGIGSGKSEVCRYLSTKGYPVYDSDSKAKALYDSVPGLLDTIEEALGCKLRDDSGKLDRKKLASVIFSDPLKRETLESILYPELLKDFQSWRSEQTSETVIMESAIALEKRIFDSLYDEVVVVTAPVELRIKRNPDAAQRIASQHLDISRADHIIENDADIESLHKKTDKIL